jgi:nitrogen fixation protein FixH
MTRTLTGRGVLLWLTVFFGIIFATNFYFVTAAIKTFSGEDVGDPYMMGVEYNSTLGRRAAQRKLGWTSTISADRLPGGHVRINVTLTHADGSPETGSKLEGRLRHPANGGLDRTLEFKQSAAGVYQAELSGVRPGAWDVIVNTPAQGTPFEATRRMWLR